MKNPDTGNMEDIRSIHNRMPRWVLILLLSGVLLSAAYHAVGLLLMLLISGIISYLLGPIIKRLEYMGLKRIVAVAAVYCCLLILLIIGDIVLLPCLQHETRNLADRLPELTRQAETALGEFRGYPYVDEMIDSILEGLSKPGNILSKALSVADLFSHAATVAFAMVLIPFFAFFILRDWPDFLKKMMRLMPSAYVETSISVLSEIDILAGSYLRGLAIECMSVGVMAGLGLAIAGVNYPVTLGILTAVLNVIPYLGPVASCLAAAFIAFLQYKSLAAVVNVIVLYIAIRLLDDFLIQPLTIGRSVKLHPMLLVISILAGQKLFGIIGMVLAVPTVTICLKVASILLENRKTRAATPENLKPSHEIIV